jgi:hypothetical protein
LRAVLADTESPQDKYGGRLAALLKTQIKFVISSAATKLRLRSLVRSRETCFWFGSGKSSFLDSGIIRERMI